MHTVKQRRSKMSNFLRVLNTIVIGGSIFMLLQDSVPGMILRAAIATPLYNSGIITGQDLQMIIYGHI